MANTGHAPAIAANQARRPVGASAASRRHDILPVHVLQAVTAVGETGNMSRAGARLGMTQSAVSQLIQQAETMLGVSLFDRSRRPIRPTSAGLVLCRRAAAVLQELRALPATLKSAHDVPELRLALSDSFADTVGPWLIQAAAGIANHLYVSQGFTPEHVRELAERRVDIVVAADSLDEVDGLSRYPLLREPLVVLLPVTLHEGGARPGLPMPPVELAQLTRRLPLIRYASQSTTGALADRFLRRLGIASARHIEVDNAAMMCALVGAGMGWALSTPLHVLQGAAHAVGVVVRAAPPPAPDREVTLLTRAGELEAIALRLAREARSVLRDHGLPALRRCVPWLRDEIAVLGA